jgi:tetratricopeptide (TPR) repeat protein
MAQVGGVGGTTGGEGGPRQQTPTEDKSLNRVSNDQSLQNKTPDGQQPAAPSPAKHQPVAKTQEEFKAYNDAAAKPDGPSAEAAADEFAQKYPQSELRAALYQHAMSLYQSANNSDKVIEMGHKALAIEPDNAPALVTIATFLVNRTRDTDLDRDERIAEAKKDAQKTIELANAGEAVPAGTPPDQAASFKDAMVSMAYAALGTIDFKDKNYPAAEQNLRKSLEPSQAQPDPISYYTLALTLQRENKTSDALDATNKCLDLSKDSPQVASYCKNLQGYLQKLVSNPPAKPATPATPAPSATPQATPPSK